MLLYTAKVNSPAFENAREKIGKLVETFKANEDRYLSPNYQEAEVRKDFIDKFFIALGWDVNHDEQTNPFEQEVKVEPAVSAGGQRRADYAFHLAPNYRIVRFFVEAKKPHGDLATADNYFQAIRYAWNSETPLAVLTDFEQLHVLDCRYKPDIDTALNRHIAKYHYSEYLDSEKFAEIYWLFSREAVADSSLEKRAKELPKPRGKAVQRGLFPGGYQSIDESFLKELDEYRKALARAFKNKNSKLDGETLTELVQRTLDRLVFLRFLEDKGIEPQRIVEHFGDHGTPWEDFVAASQRLDSIYNGVVFKRHTLLDGDSFNPDETVFADICERISHLNSPYDFDAIPIHILGSIYERFLGNVIVTTNKRASVVPKPEVRKAGGVYYTPEYIVRYIVENTIGKIIHDKSPDQISEMRFADIACGSGSFLLGVFDLLLTYHGHYYNDNPKKARKGDCITRDGKLYLSLRKKREILLNNIYGVDIDTQAVEVCQLSLYLKLLQEETTGSTHQYQLEFAHIAQMKKLLPDLSKNIVCGNSLVGRDVSDGQLFDREERRLNPMDFKDAFPEVMRQGGFTGIVGNPPYVFARDEGFSNTETQYFGEKYVHQNYQLNTFALFTERAYTLLAKGGSLGFIMPNNWLSISTMKVFRDFIVSSTGSLRIVNNRYKVFRGANVDTSLLCFEKTEPNPVSLFEAKDPSTITKVDTVDPSLLLKESIIRIRETTNPGAKSVIAKISECSLPLKRVGLVKAGLKAYETGKGTPPQTDAMKKGRVYHSTARESKLHRKYLDGRDVRRYSIDWSGSYLRYGRNLAAPRDETLFEGDRLLVRQIPSRLPFAINGAIVSGDELNDINSMIIKAKEPYSNKYILGIINSRLLSFWFDLTYDKFQRGIFPQFKVNELAEFPIRRIIFSDRQDKAMHDALVKKVDMILDAKIRLNNASTDRDKNYYQSKCASLDSQIDKLVYNLYGLTEAEIQIVEQSTAAKPTEKDSDQRGSNRQESQAILDM